MPLRILQLLPFSARCWKYSAARAYTGLPFKSLSRGSKGLRWALARASDTVLAGLIACTLCLSAIVPAWRRTRHPFAVSGSKEPSPKIESVFAASPETISKRARELISFAQSANCMTWRPACRVMAELSPRAWPSRGLPPPRFGQHPVTTRQANLTQNAHTVDVPAAMTLKS